MPAFCIVTFFPSLITSPCPLTKLLDPDRDTPLVVLSPCVLEEPPFPLELSPNPIEQISSASKVPLFRTLTYNCNPSPYFS